MLFNITAWNVEPMKTCKTVQAGVLMNVIYLYIYGIYIYVLLKDGQYN